MAETNLFYVHSDAMGYGRFGICLAEALAGLGVDVYDDMPQPDEARHSPDPNPGARSKKCHVAAWLSVPGHARGWHTDQYPVVYTMWESGSLPETFRETLHHFEQVIVPSRQNQELFSRYHPNVTFVPLGVDPNWWHPVPRPEVGATFRFLIGGSGPRKGTDLAHKAFRAAFRDQPPGGPVPQLVMKNPRAEPFYGPDVEIIGGRISAAAETDLYASAHCYLQPSRGEGFGLQPLQALAQGCPTILTAAHGHDSFAHLGIGLASTRKASDYFIYGDAGEWWEPDFDELVDQMRWVYNHYDQAVDDAARAAQVIAAEFTWAATAAGFIKTIGADRFETDVSDSAGWFTPERRLFEVVTLRDWKCDIAGTSYFFERGKSYRELADVKRILAETGVLDPVCMTGDDTGLAPSQLTGVEEYSAKHSFCPTCHQQLGTRPTRADVLEEACL